MEHQQSHYSMYQTPL